MGAKLTTVGDDAPRGAHVQLAAASDQVLDHVARVGEGADRDAVLVLVAQAGDALLEGGVVGAALDVEEHVAAPGEGLEEGGGADLVEEGAEAGGGSDRDEAAAGGRRCRGCGFGLVSSTTIFKIALQIQIKLKIINSRAFVLTGLGGGGGVRGRARTAGPVPLDPVAVDHGSGGLDVGGSVGGSGDGPIVAKEDEGEGVHPYRGRISLRCR